MERTLSDQIELHPGEQVMLKGWIYNTRIFKDFAFVILRDRRGLVQCVLNKPEELDKIKDVQVETVIEVVGTVTKKHGNDESFELADCSIKIINPVLEIPPVVINKKILDLNLDTLLNNRPLTIRNIKQQAIFRIHGIAQQAYRDFMLSQDCVEFFPPTILMGSSEGGSELFTVTYFEREAKLSQSAQLYKQICIGAFERVFAIAKCFRAENYATSRHLTEATQYEFEMAFVDNVGQILDFLQETIRFMVSEIQTKGAKELKLLEIEVMDVPKIIPRVTMKEAQEIVFKESEGKQDDRIEPDMSPEGERIMGAWAKRNHQSDYVFITHYPKKKRAFYSQQSLEDPTLTDSYDCIAGGFEIASGAIRINTYDALRQSAIEKGIDPSTIEDYLNIFKFGMPPHAGFGMGVERFTQALLGAHNVREVTMFPRDVNRLTP
jgi:nondiscriminating aspartyl-tRNA synthetase